MEWFISHSKSQSKIELTSCRGRLGLVQIRRDIFQADSLSPLLFALCVIPLSLVLRNAKAGYEFKGKQQRINHLLFMGDLKFYGKSEVQIDSLVKTIQLVSTDIGMEFGIKKCGVLILKGGKVVECEGIVLPNGETIKIIEDEGYKYLEILEMDEIKEEAMINRFKKEYL